MDESQNIGKLSERNRVIQIKINLKNAKCSPMTFKTNECLRTVKVTNAGGRAHDGS